MSGLDHRVLGIDPGTHLCGWGLVDISGSQITHVDNGVVTATTEADLGRRLARVLDELEDVIDRYGPTLAAIEGVFHSRNARSALLLGHGRGVAMAAVARRGLSIHEYAPQHVKKSVCGSGRADKAQVQQMITLRLGLPEPPQADAADAVAVALCHAQHLAFPAAAPPGMPTRPKPRRGRPTLAAIRAIEEGSDR